MDFGSKPSLIQLLRWCLCLAIPLFTACETTHYEYFPPHSDQGRICVTQCAGVRESCRNTEMQRAQWEKSSCEHRQESTYRACMARADSKDETRACAKKRGSCWASEDTSRCENDYRECFVTCGGRIRTYVE